MEVKRYLRVIIQGWWLVLTAVLISASVGLVLTYSQTPIYYTSATFVVSPSATFSDLDDIFRGLDSLKKREGVMSTYVEIATSRTVLDAVFEELGLTEGQLNHLDVGAQLISSTNILRITVESDDPLIAKTCADLIGQKTIEYVKSLYEIYDMKSLDPAYVPKSPSKPSKMQNMIMALILGSAVGIGSTFVMYNLRSTEETAANIVIMDEDTGVYNRHYLLRRLGEELSRAKRHRYPLSLALMNVEHLDVIPDMRLPYLRNEVLRRVGLFLKRYTREEDLVARFEGDTFALLFPDTSGPDAEHVLEKLQNRMEWSIFELEESGAKLNLTVTSSVAAYNFNGTGREEFLAVVERTLRQARDSGYGKVCLFEEDEQGVRRNGPTTDA